MMPNACLVLVLAATLGGAGAAPALGRALYSEARGRDGVLAGPGGCAKGGEPACSCARPRAAFSGWALGLAERRQ